MKKRIAILGAGPAGLALALNILRSHKDVDLRLIEQRSHVGGLAASFVKEGLIFDYGSHRLHPSTEPAILNDLQDLLGSDLLDRPRNGRIRLLGKFVKFPLSPFNLATNLPAKFVSGILYDGLTKQIIRKKTTNDSFADFLLAGLGPTVCHNFYFPYAQKLWGLDPKEISVVQAERRVSANNFSKMAKKLLSKLPGIPTESAGRFFYPRKGFGQICDALAKEVEKLNGKIDLSSTVKRIKLHDKKATTVVFAKNDMAIDENSHTRTDEWNVDFIFSTIPITTLIKCLNPPAPAKILNILGKIRYRAMVLCYFILETDKFTPFDAHYFPSNNEIFSRLSENKNYYNSTEPKGLTGLCLEIPCSVGDAIWNLNDSDLGDIILKQLEKAELPIRVAIRETFTRRLRDVYPIYDIGYERYFNEAYNYVSDIENLISLGRQGLFVHNNTHHSLAMAYRAAYCLQTGLNWNQERWQRYREEFSNYTVED